MIKLDVKTLIAVAGILIALGGFYYTTQLRLTTLESEIHALSTEIQILRKSVYTGSKRTNHLIKRLDTLEAKK